MHKVWAVIRREFVERVRTKWFWFSAIIGPVLSIGVIVFQIMQTIGGGVRHIAVVDSSTTGFGPRVVESLVGTRFVATNVPARPGWYREGGSAVIWMLSAGAPIAARAASASTLTS